MTHFSAVPLLSVPPNSAPSPPRQSREDGQSDTCDRVGQNVKTSGIEQFTDPQPRNWSVDIEANAPLRRTALTLSPGEPDRSHAIDDVEPLPARVAFLTHYIPLYQVRVFQEITQRVEDFRVLLSTPIEPNRDFKLDWTGLDVRVQRTITLRRRWRHARAGFDDPLYVHVPVDTRMQLGAIQPDVIVSHELGARSYAAMRYCRRHGSKLVLATFMSEHTEQGRGRLRQAVRKRLIAAADAVTYNGPSCREVLLSLGASPDKLFPFPYAADDRLRIEVAPRRSEDENRHRLLCIGQLTQRKGVMPLIRDANAYCRSSSRSLELTFIGDGPLRSSIEAIIDGRSTHGFESILGDHFQLASGLSIRLLGNQPAEELPQLMQHYSIVIAPTLADEWLMVVNEAMHAGMPVIGSIYAQAVTTMIRDGHNGWRYDPLQPGDLDRALHTYFQTSGDQLAMMRRHAIASVSTMTPSASAKGLMKAIRSVYPTVES
ncbi:MAG: glycosyltransferase family 4 protein [Planctomycetota bacterium]